MIVDTETAGRSGSSGRLLMALAVSILTLVFAALALRPADAEAQARDRARALAALPTPVSTTPPTATLLGPSVLARRALRAALPPPLTLPADVASAVPADSPEARREVQIASSETSRPTVYRLPDGRTFVVQQTLAGRGRPALVNWFEEGTVRGWPAQMYSSASAGPFRALVWWTEGPVSYYVYSGTVTVRELVRLTDQLR